MVVDFKKVELVLAQQCMNLRDLRSAVSPQTLTRIAKGNKVKPATVGRIAKALGVPVEQIIDEVKQ